MAHKTLKLSYFQDKLEWILDYQDTDNTYYLKRFLLYQSTIDHSQSSWEDIISVVDQ